MLVGVLRIGAFIAVGVATAVLIAAFITPLMLRNDPTADGLEWVPAMVVTPIYLLLVLPAFALVLIRRRIMLIIAIVLLALAYAIPLAMFWN